MSAPTVDELADVSPDVLSAATKHSTWALVAAGMGGGAAIAQAADEATLAAGIIAQLARRASALVELVDAYDGSNYRLLRDLGDHLGLSLAYVHRETVEAHVERTLSETEWAATAQFTALNLDDLDDHVGDFSTFRTDWIETVLDKAGVLGYGYTADAQPADAHPITVAHHAADGPA